MISPPTRLTPRLLTIPVSFFLLFIIYSHHGIFTTLEQYSKTPILLPGSRQPPSPLTHEASTPSLHLIGDSSMCKGGTNDGVKGVKYEGWGEFMKDYFTIPVISHAISGRSCRMYSREGRFDKVLSLTNANDYVIIQFGRNEKGTLHPKDNGKTVCPGPNITETCTSNFQGNPTTVLTFGGYISNVTRIFKEKGVNVIIASPTTNNAYSFSSDRFFDKPNEWVGYSEGVARYEEVEYVDHFKYGIEMMRKLGKEGTQELFPVKSDRSHTNALGADMMARAFVRGVVCGGRGLGKWVDGKAMERVGGDCLD
ncbi:hypothetical protein TWF102_001149 [Orbilia oligospora]|uniref:SGNH hydrolase-type esterase domain-containing protein n=2 Tax=Orbilia oligospora TaxID=2813651 RepID=A0A7C8N4U8_ORBOL|nr:hypothetical protein TWF102_001149 [Orbilia oligospora]KAF3083745.1 hypothetical protein TWF706_001096 [Orbilia oligospora]KAF3095352.1 hypothetical protein TWF103_010321 [Orbilia oligospora]KAF3143563.1 hypothetical protein TWF594_005112 [Orbilia oligospora]